MQMIGHHLQRHYYHLRMMATYGLPYLCYCLSQWRQLDGSFFRKTMTMTPMTPTYFCHRSAKKSIHYNIYIIMLLQITLTAKK